MEPVTAAGDQVSGATLPLVQWQLPHGTTAVPCPLDRESGLVRNNLILGLRYENIFCFSSFITYAVKLLSLSPNWQWATWLTDSHADSYCVLLFIATLFLILPSSFLVTPFQGSHAYSVSHRTFLVLKLSSKCFLSLIAKWKQYLALRILAFFKDHFHQKPISMVFYHCVILCRAGFRCRIIIEKTFSDIFPLIISIMWDTGCLD